MDAGHVFDQEMLLKSILPLVGQATFLGQPTQPRPQPQTLALAPTPTLTLSLALALTLTLTLALAPTPTLTLTLNLTLTLTRWLLNLLAAGYHLYFDLDEARPRAQKVAPS